MAVLLNKKIIDDRWFVALFLTFLVLVFIGLNFLYINMDGSGSFTDYHIIRGWRFYYGLSNARYRGFVDSPYPPIPYFTGTVMFWIFGFSPTTARFSIALYGIIFILSMYGLGVKISGRTGGICAASLAVSSPVVNNFACGFFPDFPQTAVSAAALYVLIANRDFKNRWLSILTGVALGIAVMTKWAAAFFLFFPFAYIVASCILRVSGTGSENPDNIKDIKKFGSAALLYFIAIGAGLFFHYTGRVQDSWERWPWGYFAGVIIPSFLYAVFLIIESRKLRGAHRERTMEVATNMGFTAIVIWVLICPWLYWSAPEIRRKVLFDVLVSAGHSYDHYLPQRDSIYTMKTILYFMKTQYIWSVFLLLIGIIYYLKNYKKLMIILISSILISSLILAGFGFSNIRYGLNLIIFTALLGGAWVGFCENLRKPVTLVIVGFCLLSMAGWLISGSPADRFFYTVQAFPSYENIRETILPLRIPRKPYPRENICDGSMIIRHIGDGRNPESPKMVPFLTCRGARISSEDLTLDAIARKKYLFFHEFFDEESFLMMIREIKPEFEEVIVISSKADPFDLDRLIGEISRITGRGKPVIQKWSRKNHILFRLDYDRDDD